MPNDHIGTPRFIQENFSINGKQIFVFNTIINSVYSTSIRKAGTENNYYNETVEKKLLCDSIEAPFSKFSTNFLNSKTLNEKLSLIKENVDIIERFVKFACFRSKRGFNMVKEQSITGQVFNFSHSDFLAIENNCNATILSCIGEKREILPIFNEYKENFINNSLGFTLLHMNDINANIIFLPLNSKCGLYIQEKCKHNYETILVSNKKQIDFLNTKTCIYEKLYGNGYLFSEKNRPWIRIKIFSLNYHNI